MARGLALEPLAPTNCKAQADAFHLLRFHRSSSRSSHRYAAYPPQWPQWPYLPTCPTCPTLSLFSCAHLPHLPHLPSDFFSRACVRTQIKVRDLSHTSVSIAPADYSSWHDVRTELMAEAKTGFKARVEAELAAAQGENLDELKAAFQQEERAIEHEIDHTVHTFSASVDVSYNFLSH